MRLWHSGIPASPAGCAGKRWRDCRSAPDTDRRFAGDGRLMRTPALARFMEMSFYQIGNGTHTHTCLRFDLIPRDGRTAGAGHTLDADLETLQRILQICVFFCIRAVIRLKAGRALGRYQGVGNTYWARRGCVAGGRDLPSGQPSTGLSGVPVSAADSGGSTVICTVFSSVGPDHPSACGCPLVARDLGAVPTADRPVTAVRPSVPASGTPSMSISMRSATGRVTAGVSAPASESSPAGCPPGSAPPAVHSALAEHLSGHGIHPHGSLFPPPRACRN